MAGNKNSGRKDANWRAALMLAVKDIDQTSIDGRKKLRSIAEKTVEEAMKGEAWAVREIGDRLDGKAKETYEHDLSDPMKEFLEQISSKNKPVV